MQFPEEGVVNARGYRLPATRYPLPAILSIT
jgi:hypothetical protein